MKKIEIDFEVHQLIEAERKGFEEPENNALRRLLKLKEHSKSQNCAGSEKKGRAFFEEGVEVPHGTLARMRYQRGSQLYTGRFLDGQLVAEGKAYSSLSAAACDLARTKDGKKTSLNGWLYWEIQLPGAEDWTPIDDLRSKRYDDLLAKIDLEGIEL